MTAYIGWLHISDNSYFLKKHFLLKNIVAAFGFFAVILFGALLSDTDVETPVLYFAAITFIAAFAFEIMIAMCPETAGLG